MSGLPCQPTAHKKKPHHKHALIEFHDPVFCILGTQCYVVFSYVNFTWGGVGRGGVLCLKIVKTKEWSASNHHPSLSL